MFTVGTKVNGQMFLANRTINFTGTITSARPHSINWNEDAVMVALDTPITVWGDKDVRTSLSMKVNAMGESWDREILNKKISLA